MYMKFYIDETTRKVLKKFPDKAVDVANSCDPNKINAKQRLVSRINLLQKNNTLQNPIPRISIVGGWYGNILIPLLDMYVNYEKIDFYEIDEEAIHISKNHFFESRIKINYILQDATKVEFSGNRHLIINTSAEHMDPLNIKSGILAVQSNDYTEINDHINCVYSEDELIKQYNFSKVWYSNTKKYDNKYNRFTVIGRI